MTSRSSELFFERSAISEPAFRREAEWRNSLLRQYAENLRREFTEFTSAEHTPFERHSMTFRSTRAFFLVAFFGFAGAVIAESDHVYVSLMGDEKIAFFGLDSDGTLVRRGELAVRGEPGALATDPDRKFLFASIRSRGELASFRFTGNSGEIAHVSTVSAAADPAFVATDRTGGFLLSAYYVAAKVAVHPVLPDGSIDAENAQWIDTADKAHAILTTVDNQYAFVPHTGPNRIFGFRFDGKAGRLSSLRPPSLFTGENTGPRQLYVHPDGRFVYFDNEQGSSVTSYRLGADGALAPIETLATIPREFTARNSCARLAGTRSGRFLYAANRGHHSIAAFSIAPSTGKLTALGTVPTETTPRGFAIDPSDRFLVAAGQDSDHLATYAIREDGTLDRLGSWIAGIKTLVGSHRTGQRGRNTPAKRLETAKSQAFHPLDKGRQPGRPAPRVPTSTDAT